MLLINIYEQIIRNKKKPYNMIHLFKLLYFYPKNMYLSYNKNKYLRHFLKIYLSPYIEKMFSILRMIKN